ncbi:MAG: hypothetical protein DRO14_00410 [Thermoprotei archaeon]|nr:MAG: hypothetical protein DRO14_00025 [Thermoprotei archaeon]RLG78611.1 MAG: hypothetical protein DRO14_00410 [Thermoprotei archaeon]
MAAAEVSNPKVERYLDSLMKELGIPKEKERKAREILLNLYRDALEEGIEIVMRNVRKALIGSNDDIVSKSAVMRNG